MFTIIIIIIIIYCYHFIFLFFLDTDYFILHVAMLCCSTIDHISLFNKICLIHSIIHCNRRLGAFANPPILYGWIYPNLLMVLMIISTYCCVSTATYSVLNCCDVISLWKDMIDWSRWRIS